MKYNKICHENKLKISSTTDGSSEQLNGSPEKTKRHAEETMVRRHYQLFKSAIDDNS